MYNPAQNMANLVNNVVIYVYVMCMTPRITFIETALGIHCVQHTVVSCIVKFIL